MTIPGEKQYRLMLNLGSGAAWLSAKRRQVEPLLRRGWVTAEWRDPFYQFVQITPDGLRALARGVEKFGLPDLGPKPIVSRRVCADCGSDRWRVINVEVER